MAEGFKTLTTIVIGLFLFSIVVGSVTYVVLDGAKEEHYGSGWSDNDNVTQSLESMRDKLNDTLDLTTEVAEGIEANQSGSDINPLDALGQGGVTAVKFTLGSFQIANEILGEIMYRSPIKLPTWMFSALVGMLLFVISMAMLIVFITVVKR